MSERGVVLGVVDPPGLAGDEDVSVESIMRAGPTIRAHEELGALLERMHARKVTKILVTNLDGRLIGLLHRDDADAALGRQHGGRR